MNKRYQFDRIFLSKKTIFKGGISYVFNYTKDLWEKQQNFKRRSKKVLNGNDVSSLTSAIKDFTDVLEKKFFSEIATQIENLVFEDAKRKNQYEAIRYADKSLITKNGKAKFERRYYKDKEIRENVCLTDRVLGIEKRERKDKKVKAELI